MDRIIENQLDTFCTSKGLADGLDISVKFEHFVNYLVFLTHCPEAYSTDRDAHLNVHTGQGGDQGIDGILIVINDTPVFSCEQAKQIIDSLGNKPLNVEFYFTQAKTSSEFDSGDMLKTKEGVKQFFDREEPTNEKLRKLWKIQDLIYRNSNRFDNNPNCYIAYATTGKWENNSSQKRLTKNAENELKDKNIFQEVRWTSIDANGLQKLYKNLNSSIKKTVLFEKHVAFPNIDGVSESHVGLIEGDNFINLVTLDDGTLNKSVFYENVRAYLGTNYVNKEIKDTLSQKDARSLFPILNNGITIVARSMNVTGDNLTLQDFQIVNGCQTSNVLYESRTSLKDVMVPVKIIATENQDIINRLIRSTNRQTEVLPEAFESIKDIHKKIQNFYDTFSTSDRLYYERRTREYDRNNRTVRMKSCQVFTIPMQLLSHVSMFCDEPHTARHSYYGKILAKYSNTVFQDTDNPKVYYTSARTLFKIEEWINSLDKNLKKKVKNYRFPYLMIIRRLIQGENSKVPPLNSGKIDKLCDKILKVVEDETLFNKHIMQATDILLDAAKKAADRNGVVDHVLLTAKIIEIIEE